MTQPILIITNPLDAHVDAMIVELARREIPVFRWHPEEFPMRSSLSCRFEGDGRIGGRLTFGGHTASLEEFRSVWLRKPMPHVLPAGLNSSEENFVGRETRQAYQGLVRLLDCLWINHPDANGLAAHKPVQLKVAANLGFRVPQTLITNDPESAREFRKRLPGEMVYKPVTWGMLDKERIGWGAACWTSVVNDEQAQKLDLIKDAPCLFQERIEKQFELRVTIVGAIFFAVAIHSQAHGNAQVRQDWRSVDASELRHESFELPEDVKAKLLTLMEHFGLVYGAVDLIVTPGGDYVFLEINPGGQYGWLEDITGLPMTSAIADLLVEARPRAVRRAIA